MLRNARADKRRVGSLDGSIGFAFAARPINKKKIIIRRFKSIGPRRANRHGVCPVAVLPGTRRRTNEPRARGGNNTSGTATFGRNVFNVARVRRRRDGRTSRGDETAGRTGNIAQQRTEPSGFFRYERKLSPVARARVLRHGTIIIVSPAKRSSSSSTRSAERRFRCTRTARARQPSAGRCVPPHCRRAAHSASKRSARKRAPKWVNQCKHGTEVIADSPRRAGRSPQPARRRHAKSCVYACQLSGRPVGRPAKRARTRLRQRRTARGWLNNVCVVVVVNARHFVRHWPGRFFARFVLRFTCLGCRKNVVLATKIRFSRRRPSHMRRVRVSTSKSFARKKYRKSFG